jgi:hypothetical protein
MKTSQGPYKSFIGRLYLDLEFGRPTLLQAYWLEQSKCLSSCKSRCVNLVVDGTPGVEADSEPVAVAERF